MKKNCILLLLIFPLLLHAGTTGKLSGTITDAQTGEPLVGVNIVLVGTTIGTITDVDGNFVILNIPPNTYSVKISFIGFEALTIEKIVINADQTTPLSYKLKSSTVQMGEVIVSAQTPAIQKDLTSSISVITQQQIEALPIASFSDLLSMQAGVVGSGSNIHVRGGRSNEVAYMIDGMYVQDPLLGTVAAQINTDAIQEMSLLSGTFNAEYGNALSGIVNIVTREGSERYNGKIESRTSEFGSARYNQLHENRVNGSFGGPLFSGARFFVSGEQTNNGSYLPWGSSRLGVAFAKVSFNPFPEIKMTVSNRGSQGRRQNYNHLYKYIQSLYSHSETNSYQGSVTATHTIAKNIFYDLKASYFNQGYFSGYSRDTSENIPETEFEVFTTVENGVEFLDFYSKATPTSLIRSRTVTAELKGDAVWQMGNVNEVKFGIQLKKHWLKLYEIYGIKRPLNLQYTDDYYTDKPYEASVYAQDKIELPYLVINIGLRFDYLNANVSFRQDPLDPNTLITVKPRTQLSPRIGIAHPISDKTKLHFAYGHFFQNPEYRYLFENKEYKISVREPLFGQPGLDARRTVAYEVGLAHQFTDRVVLNLVAYYKDETGLIGTRYFQGPPIRYSAYTLYINEDYANTKGIEATLNVRPDRYLSAEVTYTYSVAKGNASSEGEYYPSPYKASQMYYLDFDKTHVFNASATATIPENEGPELFGNKIFSDVDITMVARAASGYPYTQSGRDIGFVIKNSLRMPSTYSIDVEMGKEFAVAENIKMRIFTEILNLTDHRDIRYVYGDTGDPDFTFVGALSREYMRDPSNYGPPRTVRLGAAVKF
jgi:hypothetical protein